MVLPIDDHGTAVGRVPLLHGFERGHDLGIIVAVLHGEDVPAVGSPLIDETVAAVFGGDDAAQQDVVDAGVVVGKQDAQALADLQRQGLGLQFLGVAFGHGEFAFEGDDLGRELGGADEIPERGLARGGGDADAGRAAIHVVGDIGGFGVAGQSPDAAQLWLGRTADGRPGPDLRAMS